MKSLESYKNGKRKSRRCDDLIHQFFYPMGTKNKWSINQASSGEVLHKVNWLIREMERAIKHNIITREEVERLGILCRSCLFTITGELT